MAYRAMVLAAQGLLKGNHPYIGEEPEEVMATFTRDFHDTGLFNDPFAGPKFYQYYQQAHAHKGEGLDKEKIQQFLHESQLFVEAAHSCYARMSLAEPAEKAEG